MIFSLQEVIKLSIVRGGTGNCNNYVVTSRSRPPSSPHAASTPIRTRASLHQEAMLLVPFLALWVLCASPSDVTSEGVKIDSQIASITSGEFILLVNKRLVNVNYVNIAYKV